MRDGIFVAGNYWGAILLALIPILGFGGLLAKRLSLENEKDWLFFPLSLPFGIIALSLLSFATILLAQIFPIILPIGSWLIFGFGTILFITHLKGCLDWRSNAFYFAAFFTILVIRLAFFKELLMPPYSDPVEHYKIVQDFLSPNADPKSFYSIFGHYYHFGFHSLSVWLFTLVNTDSPLILVLWGQIFLAIIPFSVLGLVGSITQDETAAWIAFLLAGFGWEMPAFAANWGKYPMLAGTAVFAAPVAVLYLLSSHKLNKKSLLLGITLIFGVAFLHTRLLISIILAIFSYVVARQFTDRLVAKKKIIKFLLLAGGVFLSLWFHWGTFHQGYYNAYFTILIGILLLLPFAFRSFPTLALAALIFLLGMGIVAKIPTPAFLQNYSHSLLDRTFVQISLFLPLSILGGLGISGFWKAFANKKFLRNGIMVIISFLLTFNAAQLSYYPDPCCKYVRDRDVAAFNWIKLNITSEAVFFIPGLRVSDHILGTDAGIWIEASTGNKTKKRPFDISWRAPDVIADICQFDPVYIYAGGRAFSFDIAEDMETSPQYQKVFSEGKVNIYKVNCSID